MFKWEHEYTLEVDMPLKKAWEFFADLNNWPKWIDQFESFHFPGRPFI